MTGQWKELKQVHVPYEDTLVSDRVTEYLAADCQIYAIPSGHEHFVSLNHMFASVHASRRARFAVTMDDDIRNCVVGAL